MSLLYHEDARSEMPFLPEPEQAKATVAVSPVVESATAAQRSVILSAVAVPLKEIPRMVVQMTESQPVVPL